MNIDRERDQAIMDGNADRQADSPDPILAWLDSDHRWQNLAEGLTGGRT